MPSRLSLTLAVVAGLLLAAGQALCWCGVKPVTHYFYIIAWYSYIFILDHLIYRKKGESLIMDRFGEFTTMMVWSSGIWILFEGLNLRLENWIYLEVEPWKPLRYAIGIISFATVLPGIFETAEFLRIHGLFKAAQSRPFALRPRLLYGSVFLGMLFIILPVAWPLYFFPLIWVSFIFLLEPLNVRAKSGQSVLRKLSNGRPREVLLLLTAGGICGVAWEYFNFWAEVKWEYTVPFVGGWKVFEMPVLGYLGFPPFAVECGIIYAAIRVLRAWLNRRLGRLGGVTYVALAVAVTALLAFLVFPIADRKSIKSFRSSSEMNIQEKRG